MAERGLGVPPPQPITLWWLTNRAGQAVSLPEQIAAWAGERILTGAFAPGSKITEQAVSEEFSVSRAPVREAFRILERQHLVEINPRKGSRVTRLSQQEVRDIAEIRRAMMGVIAHRLAGRGDPEAIQRLESKAQDLLAFAEDPMGPDRYLWGALDLSLSMARECGNAHVVDILDQLSLPTYRYARIGAVSVSQRQKTARLWRDAVRSLKRLDAVGALTTLDRIVDYAAETASAALDAQATAESDAESEE